MKRFAHAITAFVALLALAVAGPIGSGGLAVAADAPQTQRTQLEREVDALPAGQRVQLERRLANLLDSAGVDLSDPGIQVKLAQTLGVETAEIGRAVEQAGPQLGGAGPPRPILFLFIAASLIFAPSVFKAIAGTLYEIFSAEAIEGIEAFDG